MTIFFLSQQNTRMGDVGGWAIWSYYLINILFCAFVASGFPFLSPIPKFTAAMECTFASYRTPSASCLSLCSGRWVFLLVWIAVTVTSERFINQCLAPAGHELDRLPFL